MTRNRRIGLTLATCLAFSCAMETVAVRQDSKADISKYKTYQWVSDADAKSLQLSNPKINYIVGASKVVRRPAIEPRIKASVDQHLQTKGFTQATLTPPDFYITYFGRAKDEDWVSTWTGTVPSIGNVPVIMYPNYDSADTRTYRDGDILIVFYDAKTKQPSWSGTVTNALNKQDVNMQTVTASLDKILVNVQPAA
ncbi:MAG: DUF4136 domain-containing protein [Bdellovibrionota bacterium]